MFFRFICFVFNFSLFLTLRLLLSFNITSKVSAVLVGGPLSDCRSPDGTTMHYTLH